MKLYFASSNEHKRKEMSSLLGGYTLILPKEEGISFDVEENGKSFIENALIKAEALYKIVKKPVLSDDSGLCVEALNFAPGLYTSRYGDTEEKKITSKEKYELLLKNMEGIENRKAFFVCALCLYIDPNRIYIIQEYMNGEITKESKGINGFGYDPVFYINEAHKISALLKENEKNKYSHRAKAANKIRLLLEEL